MPTEFVQLAVQAHLAEFSALRQEMLEMIKWRDRLVFLSLGISGTLFSFALTASNPVRGGPPSREMALYLIAPLATLTGGLWMVNTWRVRRIGSYIRDVLGAKLNSLLLQSPSAVGSLAFEVLGWESSAERLMHKRSRRVLEWLVLLSVFVFAGAVAQYIIISREKGPLISRLRGVESPVWFVLNCVVLSVSFLLFLSYFVYGRKYAGSPGIRQP